MSAVEPSAMDPARFGRVAVLFGGGSAEREISLLSGQAVLEALRRGGVDAHAFDPAAQPLGELSGYDVAFIVLHGRGGEDGSMQGALEQLGLPYTGSGVLASALAMDKWRCKLLWRAAGLPTPDHALLEDRTDFAAVEARLGLPLFVKPATEGSSIGVTKARQAGDVARAYAVARQYDPIVIAERYVGGGEYTVPILDGEALPAIRIVPATEFYDYDAKYFRDDTRYLCPCGLEPVAERALQELARTAFEVIGGRGWGRIDVLLDERGGPWLIEANTVPGMTSHSLVPMAARAAGIDFDTLVLRILAGAAGRAAGGRS
ncbi:MAG: D-alanine--D-alanine ligase [Gammaproteobacteria bacterium]